MPPKPVKICAGELYETLEELVNQAFTNNRLPEDMNKAEIYPIFKNSDSDSDSDTIYSIQYIYIISLAVL